MVKGRERVELEARSVIRQVGIHIYRVVKSIGVSVSRVSCKRVVGGDEMRVSHTDHPLDPPRVPSRVPFSLPIFPLRPLLLLRPPQPAALANDHPPNPRASFCTGVLLPPHISSPRILILPIIPTSSFGNPSLAKRDG